MENQNKYLFASAIDFGGGGLTGAHFRFLELLNCVAKTEEIAFVGVTTPQIELLPNVKMYPINTKISSKKPKHIFGSLAVYLALIRNRSALNCNYAISFNPTTTICYWLAGNRYIVSLFREDLNGYLKALQVSKMKIMYFQLIESLAVKMSKKIIVQCENDCKNLIKRNKRICKNIQDKVYIQINNANASWMNTENLERIDNGDIPKILFVGNFSDRRKGHYFLLPAVMKLLDEGFQFELFCAGDGIELEQWRENCSEYSQIHFLGRINNMKDYLVKSDIMLVPSLIDSCPNTVLEGLNAEMAVYGSNTGGIPDLLQGKEYLFEPNEQSIYSFIKEVLQSKRYKSDAIKQLDRKKRLTFNWGEEIKKLVES